MAGTNPYNPQTDYANWYAWEQENTRQSKAAYENSAEGQKAKQDARAKKTSNQNTRDMTPSVTGGSRDEAKQKYLKEAKIKYPENPEMWQQYVENQMTQYDRTNKTHMTVQEKAQDEQHTKDVVNQGTQEHYDYLNKGKEAGKAAQESVKALGSFDMPKASNLGEYSEIGDAAKHEGIMPKSIWQAWKNGEFNTATDPDGKKTRNYLMLNSALTAIGNAARGFEGGLQHTAAEHKDTLWQKRQEENMARQTERENVQNDVLKQAETDTKLSDIWGSFTPEQKQGVLDAKNAFATGNLSKAEDLMRNSMGDQRYSEWLQYFENLKAQLSVNADARAQEQLRYMETMGPLGMLMGLVGKFI